MVIHNRVTAREMILRQTKISPRWGSQAPFIYLFVYFKKDHRFHTKLFNFPLQSTATEKCTTQTLHLYLEVLCHGNNTLAREKNLIQVT